jgi:hypothetical protein
MKLAIRILVTALMVSAAHAKLKFIDEWEFIKEENGIKAECRTHESGIDQCRLTGVAEASVTALTAINVDGPNLKNWMENVLTSEVLPESKGQHDYKILITYNFPGARNRYSVTHSIVKQNPDTKEVILSFRLVSSDAKPKDISLVRYEQMAGYWKFRPLANGKTYIEYTNIGLPAGIVQNTPLKYVYNSSSLSASFKTFENLLVDVNKADYKNAKLDFVK